MIRFMPRDAIAISAAAAGLSALLILAPQATSAQEARFRIDARWISNEIEPLQASRNVQMSLMVTLKNGKTVREDSEHRAGNRRARASHSSRETDFGEEGGRRAPIVWKVVNEHTLVRLAGWPSHTFAIWVRTNGSASCTATLEWRLKPGFQAYEGWARRRHTPIRFTEPSSPSADCTVL